MPTRLTWHPGARSCAGVHAGRHRRAVHVRARRVHQPLHAVVQGPDRGRHGRARADSERRRAAPRARAAGSPTTRSRPRYQQWKEYRGGTVSRIWIYDPAGKELEKVPQPQTRSNDTDPMWVGNTCTSGPTATASSTSFPTTRERRPCGSSPRSPISRSSTPARAAGKVVFEQAGYLHLFDPATLADHAAQDWRRGRPAGDTAAIRQRRAMDSQRDAFADRRSRGVRVPRRDRHRAGRKRRSAQSDADHGWHERSPAWSPDGQHVAYFSDEGGEYALRIAGQDGKDAIRGRSRSTGTASTTSSTWSPDSKKLSYVDNSQSLYWVDLASGAATRIDGHRVYTPAGVPVHSWSPDSKWIAYVVNLQPLVTAVHLYSIEQASRIRSRTASATSPIRSSIAAASICTSSGRRTRGRRWTGSRNRTPTCGSRATCTSRCFETTCRRRSRERATRRSPRRPPPGGPGTLPATATPPAAAPLPGQQPAPARAPEPVRVDLDGIEFRILDMPVPAGQLANLQTGAAGHVYYMRHVDSRTALHRYDLTPRSDETLLPETSRLSALGRCEEDAVRHSGQLVDRRDDRPHRTDGRPDSGRRRFRSRSTRAPSGGRSSTRPGGSIATSSTRPTCTASTGSR